MIYPNVTQASKYLGISRNAIYNRIKNAEVKKELEDRRRAYLNSVTDALRQTVLPAVEELGKIALDKNIPAQVRVTAINSILRNYCNMEELTNLEHRIEELEQKED